MNNTFIKLTLPLFVITLAVALLLSIMHVVTRDKIEANSKAAQNQACARALPEATELLEIEEGIYEGRKDGAVVGYVTTGASVGYGGEISLMVGIDPKGVLIGIEIWGHSETPGLGAKAAGKDFTGSLAGKTLPLSVVKSAAPASNEVAAISGATITTNAVAEGINQAAEKLIQKGLIKGGAAQ